MKRKSKLEAVNRYFCRKWGPITILRVCEHPEELSDHLVYDVVLSFDYTYDHHFQYTSDTPLFLKEMDWYGWFRESFENYLYKYFAYQHPYTKGYKMPNMATQVYTHQWIPGDRALDLIKAC